MYGLAARDAVPQGLKPGFNWLETARLKPRPFKEAFIKQIYETHSRKPES
jgi:hypothetical protein